jgi:glycine C-acetyltransferase
MSSVRFICGTQDIHRKLENKVTEFLGTENTILFPSCMDANAGVFEAILTSEDIMISDRLVHASIIDGMRLCSAQHDTFKHSSMEHLEEKLMLHADKRLKLVITDGVFSMDGDTAKLDEMVSLCEKYGAMLLVEHMNSAMSSGRLMLLQQPSGRPSEEHREAVSREGRRLLTCAGRKPDLISFQILLRRLSFQVC